MKRLFEFLLFSVALPSIAFGQTLLFSDNFDGGVATGWDEVYFEAANYTPNTAEDKYTTSPTPVSGSHAAHYYARSGTNEIQACKFTHNLVANQNEIFLRWYDYFETGFPFATTSQKMARVLFYDESFPASRKEITVVARGVSGSVEYEYQCGLWGDSSLCNVDFGESTGAISHPTDVFTLWELHISLNTPGSTDGFVRLYKNETLYLSNEGIDLRGTDTKGFNAVWVGGNSSMASGTLSSSGSRYIDAIEIWDSDPGAVGGGGGGADPSVPNGCFIPGIMN